MKKIRDISAKIFLYSVSALAVGMIALFWVYAVVLAIAGK